MVHGQQNIEYPDEQQKRRMQLLCLKFIDLKTIIDQLDEKMSKN
jgi:hypothetical protein